MLVTKSQIEKFWINPLSDGRKYATLLMNQQKYTTWDPKFIAGLEQGQYTAGATLEYEWQQSGKFKNIKKIVGIKKPNGNGQRNGNGEMPQDETNPYLKKDREIVRMSSIKAGLYLTKDKLDLDLEEKADAAIELARKFEKYISSDDLSFPEDNGLPEELQGDSGFSKKNSK
ncbi:MAG: hypothetical protein MN733_36975 [Nitrososphaera sp.]|nr:hypothetical protein [Nitrososphaera sp.]